MSWIDLVAAGLIIGIAFLESHRGFGLALFDVIGAILAVKISVALTPLVAKAAPLGFTPEAAKGFWLIVLFLALGGLALLASRLLYQTTLLSLDVMDPTVGAILGIGSGLLVAHVVVRAMVLASAGSPFGEEVAETIAVRQLVELHGYHYVMHALRHVGELPASGG